MSMTTPKNGIKDLLHVPQLGGGVFLVWYRNFCYFKNTLFISLFWVVFEPLLYLLAFGFGVGHFIGPIKGAPYVEFFLPGLLVMTSMFVAFYEATYNCFARKKNFKNILLTPISKEEVIFGEILWASSKAFFSVVVVIGIVFLGGLIAHWQVLSALMVLFINGWLFASLGLLLQTFARNTDSFTYSQALLIIPMSLFCATYFPVDVYPESLQNLIWLLPLTHSVEMVRGLIAGEWPAMAFVHLTYLGLLALFFGHWANLRSTHLKQAVFLAPANAVFNGDSRRRHF